MSRILCFALILGASSVAAAQERSLDAALPAGVSVLDVRAPDTETGAVRVRLSADGVSPGALLDVWVRPSEADARALFAATAPQLASRVLVARTGLGDEAVSDAGSGRAGLVLLRRGAVLVAVRTVDPQLDAAVLGRALDGAIGAGTIGGPAASSSPVVQRTAVGVAITPSPAVLDLVVVPSAGTARRTETGWVATGPGTLVWVDTSLGVHTQAF